MTIKNEMDRSGARDSHQDAPSQKSLLDFVSPTDFVEIPSKGMFYAESHPLYKKEVIEIKYMTAKEEDILTSETLLRKGLAVERFLESVILDKTIDPQSLLIGDRNAILIAARISGYGASYDTKMQCPACDTQNEISFDISNPHMHYPDTENVSTIEKNENDNFVFKLPVSKFEVECRLLTGRDEQYLVELKQNKKKKRLQDSAVTDQFKMMIASIQGVSDKALINQFIEVMPAADARSLRKAYSAITPNVKLKDEFSCTSCGHVQELEVPFGADFFWPDR